MLPWISSGGVDPIVSDRGVLPLHGGCAQSALRLLLVLSEAFLRSSMISTPGMPGTGMMEQACSVDLALEAIAAVIAVSCCTQSVLQRVRRWPVGKTPTQ